MDMNPVSQNNLAAPVRVGVAGHDLTLFVESPALFAAMLDDIRAAQQRVWLETYIILDDPVGRRIAEALKEKARAGLDVRLHYDAIGSLTTPYHFFRDLENAGVRVHAFHSFWEALWRFRILRVLNRRNHRKLLVIDDRVAYFGGMNVADVTNIRTVEQAEHVAWSSGWRDVHVRLEGPQLPELAESFERSWKRAHGERIRWRPRGYRRAQLDIADESIQFFDSGPRLKHTRAARVFRQLIRAARKTITLSMAYFVPVGGVLRELIRAHRRGVFIRTVVPGKSDVPIVHRATRHLYRRLLRKRFHVYERQVDMLHSKVMVVDGEWVVLGSSNLDARSLWINLEFLAVIHSRKLAQAVSDIVRYEIAHSRRITLKNYLRQPCWQRLFDRLAWSLRWWL
jgi:cardiolipin synthase A/B